MKNGRFGCKINLCWLRERRNSFKTSKNEVKCSRVKFNLVFSLFKALQEAFSVLVYVLLSVHFRWVFSLIVRGRLLMLFEVLHTVLEVKGMLQNGTGGLLECLDLIIQLPNLDSIHETESLFNSFGVTDIERSNLV